MKGCNFMKTKNFIKTARFCLYRISFLTCIISIWGIIYDVIFHESFISKPTYVHVIFMVAMAITIIEQIICTIESEKKERREEVFFTIIWACMTIWYLIIFIY